RDDLEPSGGDAGQLQGHADGGRAAGSEENAPQITGSEFGELSREGDGEFVGVAPATKRKRVELSFDRGDDLRMAETHLVHVVPVEIEVAAAFYIFDPRALTGLERVEAGRGERLMEKVVRVFFEQSLCFP